MIEEWPIFLHGKSKGLLPFSYESAPEWEEDSNKWSAAMQQHKSDLMDVMWGDCLTAFLDFYTD